MILHPAVIALLLASLLTSGMLIAAGAFGALVLRRWDLRSGSALQLGLERRTYLVSALVAQALGLQILSLFLLVFTADGLAPLFTGAMCAAGSLKAGPLGYPVLLLKLLNSVLAGLWLIVNHADARGFDYPLIRVKYAALLGLVPPVLLEGGLQAGFFLSLRPEVITSCCGSLFGSRGSGLGSDLAALPPGPAGAALFLLLAAALAAGWRHRRSGRAGWALALLSAAALPVSLAAVISFVSPYVYELPTHHCPFCLLQREYRYMGYGLYGALLGGTVAGMGVGVLMPFRRVASLAAAVPALQRRLAGASVALLVAFAAMVAWSVVTSHLEA